MIQRNGLNLVTTLRFHHDICKRACRRGFGQEDGIKLFLRRVAEVDDIIPGVSEPGPSCIGVVKAQGKCGKTVFIGKAFDKLVYLVDKLFNTHSLLGRFPMLAVV